MLLNDNQLCISMFIQSVYIYTIYTSISCLSSSGDPGSCAQVTKSGISRGCLVVPPVVVMGKLIATGGVSL